MNVLKNISSSAIVGAAFLGLLAVGLSTASGESLVAKPTEAPDGTLSFDGLSDRQLLEFTANQIWLSNRRAAAATEDYSETAQRIRDLSKMIDQAERNAVQIYLPSLPENSGSFGRYFYRDQEAIPPVEISDPAILK